MSENYIVPNDVAFKAGIYNTTYDMYVKNLQLLDHKDAEKERMTKEEWTTLMKGIELHQRMDTFPTGFRDRKNFVLSRIPYKYKTQWRIL